MSHLVDGPYLAGQLINYKADELGPAKPKEETTTYLFFNAEEAKQDGCFIALVEDGKGSVCQVPYTREIRSFAELETKCGTEDLGKLAWEGKPSDIYKSFGDPLKNLIQRGDDAQAAAGLQQARNAKETQLRKEHGLPPFRR